MPIFPGLVTHNNPNEAIIDVTGNQVKGLGVFATISGVAPNRNSLSPSVRCEGYIALVKDLDIFYVYTSTDLGNTAWQNASNWVQLGQQGPQGPQGIQGLKGDTGATGAAGPQGIQGATGATGPAGPTGATGPAGPTGATGPAGTNGIDGKTVLNGTTSPAANLGVIGDFYINTSSNLIFGPKTAGGWGSGVSLVGPQGAAGATGAQGPQGIAGATGATGATGPQGLQGPAGATGATGAAGANGVDGKTVLNGTSDPSSGTGVAGDFYINTSSKNIFGPKVGTNWGTGVSLVGPTGPQGATGATGPQGLQGPTGATGATGPAGAAGKSVTGVSVTNNTVTTTLSDSTTVSGTFSVNQSSITPLAGAQAGQGSFWDEDSFENISLARNTSIPVSIPNGRSFGKYITNDTITISSYKSALDLIIDAVQLVQNPSFSSWSVSTIPFNTTDPSSVTVSYNANNLNSNLGRSIRVLVYRKNEGASDSTYALIHTSASFSSAATGSQSFPNSYTLSAYATAGFTYKFRVEDVGDNSYFAEQVLTRSPEAYLVPSIGSLTAARISTSNSSGEINAIREKGNTSSTVTFNVTINSANVPINSLVLQRSIDGGTSYTGIHTFPSPYIGSKTYTDNYTNNSSSLSSILYRVVPTTSYPSNPTGASGNETTVTLSKFAVKFLASPNALPGTPTAADAIYDTTPFANSVLRDNTISLGAPMTFNGSSDTNNTSNFSYILYPTSLGGALSVINMDGSTSVISDFGSPVAFNITNQFSVSIEYRIYKSNSKGAFSSTNTLTSY